MNARNLTTLAFKVDKGNKEPVEKMYRIHFNFMGELRKKLYSHCLI